MKMVTLIKKKRDGGELSTAEIEFFVNGYCGGDIPDYQAAAMLMAIFIRGMNRRETVELTQAMARSGDQLDLHDVAPLVVDKHSSGGVGDKTTLVVQPLVAACGVPVGKMSGRGLGPSGGTLDKMESFSGWSCQLSIAEFKRQLAEIGLVLAGQTADLAPADGKLYALRDVTATVASPALIASSIMSKKLAGGADAIVLDVKVGSGAFVPDVPECENLARLMVDIGRDAGRRTVALISDMNQPLGHAVGNALEVREAMAALQGGGPPDLWRHCVHVASHMLWLAGKAESAAAAEELVEAARQDGRAWEKFRQMVLAQGGDARQLDDPDLLPQADLVEPLLAPAAGVVAAMDAGAMGWAAVNLGAGRLRKGDACDHAAGFVLRVKVGDRAHEGQAIGEIHANDADRLAVARQELLDAIEWSAEAVEPLPHSYGVVT